MATWNVKQAKDNLSAIIDRALDGKPQEILRRGDPPVIEIVKSALDETADPPRSILEVLTKYADLTFEIPRERDDHREAPEL